MVEQPARRWTQWLLIGIVLLYAGILLVAPIIAIVQGAFKDGIQPVIDAVTTPDALLALRLTFVIALIAGLVNTIFGVLIAWVLVRHEFPGKRLLNALVDLPFVVSPVIVGYVMIVLFGRQGWLKDFPIPLAFSFGGMVVVTIFVCLPFVIREVMPVLASLTPEQEEAAYTLGASRWLTYRRIVFPIIRHAVIYGVVLTIARGLGEFGAVAVIGGGVQGSTETATVYVYRTLQDRNPTAAYGMAITLGLVSVIILTLMNRLRGHGPAEGARNVDQAG